MKIRVEIEIDPFNYEDGYNAGYEAGYELGMLDAQKKYRNFNRALRERPDFGDELNFWEEGYDAGFRNGYRNACKKAEARRS